MQSLLCKVTNEVFAFFHNDDVSIALQAVFTCVQKLPLVGTYKTQSKVVQGRESRTRSTERSTFWCLWKRNTQGDKFQL